MIYSIRKDASIFVAKDSPFISDSEILLTEELLLNLDLKDIKSFMDRELAIKIAEERCFFILRAQHYGDSKKIEKGFFDLEASLIGRGIQDLKYLQLNSVKGFGHLSGSRFQNGIRRSKDLESSLGQEFERDLADDLALKFFRETRSLNSKDFNPKTYIDKNNDLEAGYRFYLHKNSKRTFVADALESLKDRGMNLMESFETLELFQSLLARISTKLDNFIDKRSKCIYIYNDMRYHVGDVTDSALFRRKDHVGSDKAENLGELLFSVIYNQDRFLKNADNYGLSVYLSRTDFLNASGYLELLEDLGQAIYAYNKKVENYMGLENNLYLTLSEDPSKGREELREYKANLGLVKDQLTLDVTNASKA